MDAQKQRYRLGVFVVGASILLAMLTVFFGGTPWVFSSRDPYTIIFTDAPGVSVGTPVRRSGVRIGEVTSVELDNDTGEVMVRIAVNKKFSLRTTDQAIINQDLLSRDTTIDFIPRQSATAPLSPAATVPSSPAQPDQKLAPPVPTGPAVPVHPDAKDKGVTQAGWQEPVGEALAAGQQPLEKQPPAPPENPPAPLPGAAGPGEVVPPGSTIRGRSQADPRTLLNQATDVIPSVQQSLNQIRRLIEVLTPRLDDATREFAQLARSLRETVPEVRRTNDELRLVIQGFRTFGPALRRTNDELQTTITNFGRAAERIDVLIQTNQATFERTLHQLGDLTQRANNLLNDENQRNVTTALKNFQSASHRFESIANNTDELLKDGRKTVERFQQSLNQADMVLANINQATRPLAERGERVLRNLDVAFEQIARTAVGLGEFIGPIGRGEGSMQKFFSDPSIYNNLNDATLMLTRILPRVDRALQDFQTFADKIARHPELIGVGGAVRPSAGLKDGPSGIAQPQFRQHP